MRDASTNGLPLDCVCCSEIDCLGNPIGKSYGTPATLFFQSLKLTQLWAGIKLEFDGTVSAGKSMKNVALFIMFATTLNLLFISHHVKKM